MVVGVGDEVQVRRLSTSVVPQADRYAFWEQTMRSSQHPVRLSPAKGGASTFHADFLRVDAGPVAISRGSVDPVRSEITPAAARQHCGATVRIALHEGGRTVVNAREGLQVISGRALYVQPDDEPVVQTHTERVPLVVLTVESARLSVPVCVLRSIMFLPLPADGLLRSLVLGAAETARPSSGGLDPAGMSAYLAGVAELVLRTIVGRPPEHAGTAEVRRQQVRELVRSRFDDPHLTATVVSETVGVSPRRLHQLFTGGPTVAAQIRTARMDRAQVLLADPLWCAQPVSAVARHCGFLDHSQFSRAFRAHTGMTPRAFRS